MKSLCLDAQIERPKHGGDILEFCQRTGRTREQCIDLSTGIAPWAWPPPDIPTTLWQRLPSSTNLESELLEVAATYYGCEPSALLAVAGSQSAIEILPRITGAGISVAIPKIGYQEHLYIWKKVGAKIFSYESRSELEKLVADAQVGCAIVINPNNPSGELVSVEYLESIRERLRLRGGFLVVDEAFIDPMPDLSMAQSVEQDGLIVLRSIGKFFGLAGLRLGFVCAAPRIIESLKSENPLWSVSTPALWLGAKMLNDRDWISSQKRRCAKGSKQLEAILKFKFNQLEWIRSELFVSGQGSLEAVKKCADRLANIGIHVRLVPINDARALLRIGLADDQSLEILGTISD